MLGQRAVDGDGETRHRAGHQISAPSPNKKNDRKKELAANAIDRPKTIWMSQRKPLDGGLVRCQRLQCPSLIGTVPPGWATHA
ncbi:hypothetical protein BGCPKDLD_2597 [Methylorubrum suomiense]|uniref:Uncharacterized protein n=1 Tax=Methylorubrum suomiense TaxID=144191 RepID=A0ABQ4UUL3_9HYPH|nr:hypothetical protein BGCPKDLD_2597 [Methylorubrum suomiense]